MSSLNKIISTSSFLVINLFSLGLFPQISSAQDYSDVLGIPLNLENPNGKEDFIQQCTQNLQTNGISLSQASSYCNCSGDAVYEYSRTSNTDITSQAAVLEKILQCRAQYIPTDS
jgi:hypothetical protein